MKKTTAILLCSLCLIAISGYVSAEEYNAVVTTAIGTYDVPVEVENGEVTTVYWSNSDDMSVNGALIDDGTASGYNSEGDSIGIELD